jgi:hypothetical protein
VRRSDLPAKNAPRFFRYYASSFFAGKPRSHRFPITTIFIGKQTPSKRSFEPVWGTGGHLLQVSRTRGTLTTTTMESDS